MNQKEILKILGISAISAILIYFILVRIFNHGILSDFSAFKYLTVTSSIVSGFWAFYFKVGWKWRLLKKIIPRPNISGIWIGYGNSDYINGNGIATPPYKILIIIDQTCLKTNITGFTKAFNSYSYAETFTVYIDHSKKSLAYLYSSNSMSPYASNSRDGASELIVSLGNKETLSGDFWTRGGSTGNIKVFRKEVGKKEIESFQDAFDKWKNPKDWI